MRSAAILSVVTVLLAVAPVVAEPPLGTELHRSVEEICRHHGVDPLLVDAVIRVESAWNPVAVSPKGAQGLMQLMPATAARLAVVDPFDPVDNVRGGVTELSRLLRRFSGDLPLALAAYNAGEGAVERYRGVPPYRETQGYVSKIIRLYTGRPWDGEGALRSPVRLERRGEALVITNTGAATGKSAAGIAIRSGARPAPRAGAVLEGGFGR